MEFLRTPVRSLQKARLSVARLLFIVLGGAKPSTRLRMLPALEGLRRNGHVVTLRDVPAGVAGRVALLQAARQHDCVLLQKKLFPAGYARLLSAANPRLVFDVDDAVMFHEVERGETVSGKFFPRFMAIAAASRGVVAGNRYLAEFAAAARPADAGGVTILPTPIDTLRLQAKPTYSRSPEIVIGWLGTKGNLQQLLPLSDALRDLAREFPQLRLRIVADASIEIPGVTVECKPWRADEENADLQGFDIGIMPLADTLWTRGKGGYKLLQYMAAGLSAVASPVGINSDIVRHGENGLLAARPTDWHACLRELIVNPDLRQRLGQAARQTVETDFCLDGYVRRYVALLEDCLQ